MNPLVLLKLVPGRTWLDIGLALAFVAFVAWFSSHERGIGYAKGHAEAVAIQGRWDADRARMALAVAQAEAQRAKDEAEARSIQQEQEKLDAQAKQLRVTEMARADDARRGLLDTIHRLAAAADSECGSVDDHSAAVAGSEPAQRPGDLLAGMLERSDATEGELGRYADELSDALHACRVEYDSVRSIANAAH